MTVYYQVNQLKFISFNKTKPEITPTINLTSVESIDQAINIINSVNPEDEHIILIDSTNEMFNDIIFNIDSTKVGLSSNSANKTQDVNNGILLGSSNMLDAYSTGKFVITPGKKNANIQAVHQKQTHEVIDNLAINGLMNSPKVMNEISVGKLLLSMKRLTNFKLYIIHPALKVSVLDGTLPSNYVIPCYTVGEGEILSVWFRYISLLFFGYTLPNDENDIERNYDI